MDVMFTCPSCKQQLEADSSLSGTSINCPACNAEIAIPEPDPANVKTSHSSAMPIEEKHFVVPVSEKPTESLIQKANPPLDAAARKKDGNKTIMVKCIRHGDCVEVGKDKFDEIVTHFLEEVGEENVVSINTFNYSHIDLGSRQMIQDYGVMVVYRG